MAHAFPKPGGDMDGNGYGGMEGFDELLLLECDGVGLGVAHKLVVNGG